MILNLSFLTQILPILVEKKKMKRRNDERKFLVFETTILRKIFGPVKDRETGEWRVRKNNELERLFRKDNILNTIRNRRL